MGNSNAVKSLRHEKLFEMTPHLLQMINQWKLTSKELSTLYRRFCALDTNHNDTLEFDEFFHFSDYTRIQFLDPMFQLINWKRYEHMQFSEWIEAVFSFCLASKAEIEERVFYTFDTNKNGCLDLDELHVFFVSMHGANPIMSKHVVGKLTAKNLADQGRTDFDEYLRAAAMYPMLLYPVFRLQEQMQREVMTMSIFQTMNARIDADVFDTSTQSRALRSQWRSLRNCLTLYACGWPCCRGMARRRAEEKYRYRMGGGAAPTAAAGATDVHDDNEGRFIAQAMRAFNADDAEYSMDDSDIPEKDDLEELEFEEFEVEFS
jgi:Ca2+-binding EF-hand superfamily protein